MRLNYILLIASFAWLLVSFWNRHDVPNHIDYVPEILNEPSQTKTRKAPFDTTYKGVEYRVEPEYEYELYGMIVSFRHHEGNRGMHRASNDHLNMLDVCVIWGENTRSPWLQKFKFWNGMSTCNVETKNRQAWDAFNPNQLSNNHLISDDELIRDRVTDVQVGDQIRVRGFLASYGSDKDRLRGTSTSRTDRGNGACETLFVERFEIVESATSFWRMSMYSSMAILLFCLFVQFRQPYRPYQ